MPDADPLTQIDDALAIQRPVRIDAALGEEDLAGLEIDHRHGPHIRGGARRRVQILGRLLRGLFVSYVSEAYARKLPSGEMREYANTPSAGCSAYARVKSGFWAADPPATNPRATIAETKAGAAWRTSTLFDVH